MTRPQRRAVTAACLLLDLLSGLALAGAVIAGALPPGRATAPAVTLAIGIAGGSLYLYWSRPRVVLLPLRPKASRCPYDSCHHNHEEGGRS